MPKGFSNTRDSFWNFVAPIMDDRGCWEWMGNIDTKGYGYLSINGRKFRASRLSWELHFGSIAPGLDICHHCDNRSCVKPLHLFAGTRSENMFDASRKGRAPKQKLSDADVAAIRVPITTKRGAPCRQLAERYGISLATVYNVRHGTNRKPPQVLALQAIARERDAHLRQEGAV